jgi:glyoxylase-like metal-dependent hydrolase (beta-lactamase superfamily II)
MPTDCVANNSSIIHHINNFMMLEVIHLNCVRIVSPIQENVCGHCLLLKENEQLLLIDTGIGLLDTLHPEERIGQQLIDLVGFRFDEKLTAIRQIEQLGLDPDKVTDCVISHLDSDHIGGLADFPLATVHVASEELENFHSGNPRYLQAPLSHDPRIQSYASADAEWFGFEARKVNTAFSTDIFLIPLFGHTLGHCGAAFNANGKWIFYIGDAYYLRSELSHDDQPVNELARMRADDNALRMVTLERIRQLMHDHPEIDVFGYHDIEEFRQYQQNVQKAVNQ